MQSGNRGVRDAFAPPPEHWGRPDPELVNRYAGWGLVAGGARAEHVVR